MKSSAVEGLVVSLRADAVYAWRQMMKRKVTLMSRLSGSDPLSVSSRFAARASLRLLSGCLVFVLVRCPTSLFRSQH
jgi:hypothetical protein